jgi:hypothetical protein
MHHTLFVPVRQTTSGMAAVRTGRLLSGERVGLAFTSEVCLVLTLGPSQQWIRLAPDALRGMLTPLGITEIMVDSRPAAELKPLNREGFAPVHVQHTRLRGYPVLTHAPAAGR